MTTLETRSLTFSYRAGMPVIEGADVAIEGGGLTAITGVSGSGKSTLLYLLAGLLTPWSGVVRLDGVDQSTLTDEERARQRARRFGFVFQDAALDPRRSIRDAVTEVALYAGGSRASVGPRADALLDRLGVMLRSAARPGEISGGQAQRVGVCRALVLRPDVIFADEPTGNLDEDSSAVVLEALSEAASDGAAVIIATHDPRVIDRCRWRIALP